MKHFVFWMVYLILCTMNLIFWRTFHFWEWVLDDLDDIFAILNGDYTIWDDYLVFELAYFVFLLVYLVCWGTLLICGNIPVCILDDVFCFFDDKLVFGMVHFRGPICHFLGADSWAPDSWAPEMYLTKNQKIIKKTKHIIQNANSGVSNVQI